MKINEKFPMLSVAVAYAVFIATCYLVAYWGSFGINIFEFANFSDFAKLAIHPVAFVVGGMIVGSMFYLADFSLFGPRKSTAEPPRILRFISRNLRNIALLGMVGVYVSINIVGGVKGWLFSGLFIIPFSLALADRPPFDAYVASSFYRRWVLTLLVGLPFFVVSKGLENAERIKSGKAKILVEKVGVASSLAGTDEKPLEYIGFVGGTFVIYETLTQSIVLAKQIDSAVLILKERESK